MGLDSLKGTWAGANAAEYDVGGGITAVHAKVSGISNGLSQDATLTSDHDVSGPETLGL